MRFKKGDRVRYTAADEGYNEPEYKGREGVVIEDTGRLTVDVDWNGDHPCKGVFRDNLELVEQPKFKVGDRVRQAKACSVNLSDHWAIYWAKPGDARVTEFFVSRVVGNSISFSATKGGSGPMVEAKYLELVDWDYDPRSTKPEPLKIEACKFYKTRDGRKVGPMATWERDCFHVHSGTFASGLWNDDGSAYYEGAKDSPTLIAEWTSCCAAAQVDNLRDEYGPFTKAGAKAEPVAAGNDNSKPKFKVGDFLTKKTGGWRDEGYEVKKIEGGSVYLDDTHGDTAGYDLNDRDFVVVKAAIPTTPAIVCLIENGQPKPSTEPHVHANKEAAGKEATRLARKFPGQEFGVYELVDTRQEAKPTYKYEWQTLAAEGRKIEAIKELRAMTGLGLKATKDAVEHWIANDEPRSRLAA